MLPYLIRIARWSVAYMLSCEDGYGDMVAGCEDYAVIMPVMASGSR